MIRAHDLTLYCTDPTCDGWTGVQGRFTGDDWTTPGETTPEECPHCHGHLTTEWGRNDRIDVEAATDHLLDQLDEHNLLPSNVSIDATAVVAAVIVELRKQAADQARARVWTPTAIAEANARIDQEFPPHAIPAWLTTGVTK